MFARVATWWTFLQISLNERLVYRGGLYSWNLDEVSANYHTNLFMVGPFFRSVTSEDIAGYRFGDIIAYYLLTTISRAFSSMPGLTNGIANQVRSGEIKKFLIQPIDMGRLFTYSASCAQTRLLLDGSDPVYDRVLFVPQLFY